MIRLKQVKDHPTPIKLPLMRLAFEHCKGQGVEIGAAAHNSFDLPGSINVCPWDDDPTSPDYGDFVFNRDYQVDMCGSYAEVDMKGEADRIPVAAGSQDYVISSHVIEHVPDVISAFLEWKRILKVGGVVLMIYPKCDTTPADIGRPVTPLSEFIEDYEKRHTVVTHPPLPPGHGYRGHFHVFTLRSMLGLIDWCNKNLDLGWEVVLTEETDSKVTNGHTIIARQLAPAPKMGPGRRWLRQLGGRLFGRPKAARAGSGAKVGS